MPTTVFFKFFWIETLREFIGFPYRLQLGISAPSLSDLFDRSWIDNSGDEELEYELVALDEKPRRR